MRRDQRAGSTRPSVQGAYLLRELRALTNHNWARVAGRDAHLPAQANGHDEFAAAWQKEILRDLHGLPVGVVRQPFSLPGFKGLPATSAGENIMVVVPGSRRPDRAVVIGAHYDGEPTSKGSVYDDASGCAVMLGLARELGAVWRKSGPPSLTVEFVLFDAEEQGLIGSMAYAYGYKERALMPRPVLMIDEEQSGVGYPVRPFGLRGRTPIPSVATTTSRVPDFVLHVLGSSAPPGTKAVALLTRRLEAARSTAFASLRFAYPSVPFRGGSARTFERSDEHFLQIGSIPLCCSDNAPFDALAVPTVTLAGDAAYYGRDAPDWAYPFDQPQDTLSALACDTSGSPKPGRALAAALDLPLALSRSIVSVYAPPRRGTGHAVFSSAALARRRLRLQVLPATRAQWTFGDGSRATGAEVHHAYRRPGTYHVTLRLGRRQSVYQLAVHSTAAPFRSRLPSIDAMGVKRWSPQELRSIAGCH